MHVPRLRTGARWFLEQITDGANGLLYDPDDPTGLTGAIARALDLDDASVGAMRQAAHDRVTAERDIVANLACTLRFFWDELRPQPGT